MNHTEELLLQIKAAVADGRLCGNQIPVREIKQCVYAEISVNQNTFLESQYSHVLNSLEMLCEDISDEETDKDKVVMFIDALVLCINMISRAVQCLANKDYWMYKHQQELNNPEIMEIIDFIDRQQSISLLNYEFVQKYKTLACNVFNDAECGMKFVPYKGKKMFFPKGWDDDRIIDYYQSIMAEQDIHSPHCYRKPGYMVEEGDVVIDVGAAEGIFSLDVIDRAGKLYLIESDEQWVEALKQTFRDDQERVQIVHGFLDCVSGDGTVSIDDLFEKEEINYIKMDIEGYEKPALSGAENTLQRCRNIKIAVCTYHCREDEEWIGKKLRNLGFTTDVSRGYICPDWSISCYLEAELRRGIMFGKK